MTVWFVSRHPGAIAWAAEEGLIVDRQVEHLHPSEVMSGDVVIGSLPVQLAADVCRRGARYLHLSISIPRELRGQELSVEDMRACGAALEEFQINALDIVVHGPEEERDGCSS